MNLDRIPGIPSTQCREEIKDYPFILLSPRLRHRNAAIARLIDSPNRAWFYTLTAEDRDPTHVTKHLLNSPLGVFKNMSAYLKALTEKGIHCLVLDQFDYL